MWDFSSFGDASHDLHITVQAKCAASLHLISASLSKEELGIGNRPFHHGVW